MASNPRDIEPSSLLGASEEDASAPSAPPSPALSALWYTLVVRSWMTLAVVSPGNGERGWQLARGLVGVGQEPRLLRAVNALRANAERLSAMSHALHPKKLKASSEPTRHVLAVDSPLENPQALGLLGVCDAIVLVLGRQRTAMADGRRILELVGPERFIGAVLDSW